jgi:multiple sugar transport system substrate-binding protein
MKKALSIACLLALLLGCFVPSALAQQSVSFSFWGGWTGPDADTMKGIVEKYMAEHPGVTINFETQQWTPLFTKFLTDASTGNAPQVVAMRPMDMGQFIELGLMDDSFAGSIGIDPKNYSEAAWAGTMYGGKQYAIPLDQHMHGLYYNEDMLRAAGIENPPATGEELIEDARKLTIDKNGKNSTEEGFDKANIVQYGFSFNMNHHVGFQMSAMIAQQGGTPFTGDMAEVPFDSEQAVKALSFLQDLVIKYGVCPVGDKTPVASFTAGSVAMFVDGPWQMPTLEATDLNWKTARYPNVFGQQIAWGNEHILTFPKSTMDDAQKQAVKDFILWMDQNSGEWAKSGQIPASISGQAIAATLPGRQAFIDSMSSMYLLPASPKSAELFGSSATSPFVVAAQSLLLDGNDPAAVVEQLKSDMNAILSMP